METVVSCRNTVLDAWRGLAVLALLIGHFVPGMGTDAPIWGVNFGRLGVELFFALSGCLIGGILFNNGMTLHEFALRRFARIVPSMWVFLIVAVNFTALRGHENIAGALPAAIGVLNLFDLRWYAVRYGHLWSVCLELQGYFALGIVACFARSRYWSPTTIIAAMISGCWILTFLRLHLNPQLGYYSVFVDPLGRLTAMMVSAALVAERSLAAKAPWPLFLALGVVSNVVIVPDLVKYTVGSCFLAVACARIALAPDECASKLTARWLLALGASSYSIYLWQQLIYAEKRTLSWPIALSIAIVLGFVAHRIWDQRIHRASDRILRSLLGPKYSAPRAE